MLFRSLDDDVLFEHTAVLVEGFAMLTMAFLGRLLTRAVPLSAVRALDGRFVAMAFPGDTITCTGTIAGKSMEEGERRVAIDLVAQNQRGEPLVTGKAIVALP